jgi:hypothetical protein
MATHDVYYGGSRDGQRFDLDGNIADQGRVVTGQGDVYVRMPDLDTGTDRAWISLPSDRPTAANGVHVEPQQGKKYLTLQDLRTLLVAAERMGHAPDAVLHARVAWRGQVLTLGIKAAADPVG